ncbi:MAG TPA: hypothetical protein VFA03_06210 [Acetobacteraceae bacterium]|nr:hypothetical protein [Acetobacteraceae bacterium]
MGRAVLLAGLLAALAVPMLNVPPAHAGNIIFGAEDPDLFGNLNQGDTQCPNVACGPTAAVNSFIFLQNRWPKVYGDRLVPEGADPAAEYQNMIDVANTLGGGEYMNTCTCGTGTFIEQFIVGKQYYIDAMAPNTTTYGAEVTTTWRDNPGGNHVGAKPAYVHDKTAPTIEWLAEQLNAGEDVELFINGTKGNHYVVLTQIEYDENLKTGYINFVDSNQPGNGMVAGVPTIGSADITGFDPDDMDILLSSTDLSYLGGGLNIVNAVSESPIPEPGGLAVLAALLVAIGALRRRYV